MGPVSSCDTFSLVTGANSVGDGYVCIHSVLPNNEAAWRQGSELQSMLIIHAFSIGEFAYSLHFICNPPNQHSQHLDSHLHTRAGQWKMWVIRGHVHSWDAARGDPQRADQRMETRRGGADKFRRLQLWDQLVGIWIPILAPVSGAASGKSLETSEICSSFTNKENRMYQDELFLRFKMII